MTMTRPSAKASRAGIGQTRGARDQRIVIRPGADERGCRRAARLARDERERVDQRVYALGLAQLADIEEVGRVTGGDRGREFLGAKPVEHDAGEPAGQVDMRRALAPHMVALEQEQLGASRQRLLDAHIKPAARAARRIIEAAAVRGIGADGPIAAREPREKPALRAMPVHDVGASLPEMPREGEKGGQVGGMRVAMDRRRGHAEARPSGNTTDRLARPLAVAVGVEEQADGMAARGLFAGQIDHMAKQPAEGGAKDMDDPQVARTRHLKAPLDLSRGVLIRVS
jgi:hypothetical protein